MTIIILLLLTLFVADVTLIDLYSSQALVCTSYSIYFFKSTIIVIDIIISKNCYQNRRIQHELILSIIQLYKFIFEVSCSCRFHFSRIYLSSTFNRYFI